MAGRERGRFARPRPGLAPLRSNMATLALTG